MIVPSFLCCFVSFIYATTTTSLEITMKKEEGRIIVTGMVSDGKNSFSLTERELNKCPVLKELYGPSSLVGDKTVIESVAGFKFFSYESLSLALQSVPANNWENLTIGKVISTLEVMDFCGNEEGFEYLFAYLQKRCKLELENINNVIELLGKSRISGLLDVCLSELPILGKFKSGVDFVNPFLPMMKNLSVDSNAISWILKNRYASKKPYNLETLTIVTKFSNKIEDQNILLGFFESVSALKTLRVEMGKSYHGVVQSILKQNPNLELVELSFLGPYPANEIRQILFAASELIELKELVIQFQGTFGPNVFNLRVMEDLKFSCVEKLHITMLSGVDNYGELFGKFPALKELEIKSSMFSPTRLLSLFESLSALNLNKFVFEKNQISKEEAHNRGKIGNELGDAFSKFITLNLELKVLNMTETHLHGLSAFFLPKFNQKNGISIKELTLYDSNVSFNGSELGFDLRQFEVLDLQGNILSDSYFKSFCESGSIPNLKILRLSINSPALSPNTSFLAKFIHLCPNLEEITILKCVDPTFISALILQGKYFPKLKKLNLRFDNVVVYSKGLSDDLMGLLLLCQNLEYLSLYLDAEIPFPNIPAELVLEKLRFLDITWGTLYNAVQFISKTAPNLSRLAINWHDSVDEESDAQTPVYKKTDEQIFSEEKLNAAILVDFIKNGNLIDLFHLSFRRFFSPENSFIVSEAIASLPRLLEFEVKDDNSVVGKFH